jgi:hypothetical protein
MFQTHNVEMVAYILKDFFALCPAKATPSTYLESALSPDRPERPEDPLTPPPPIPLSGEIISNTFSTLDYDIEKVCGCLPSFADYLIDFID